MIICNLHTRIYMYIFSIFSSFFFWVDAYLIVARHHTDYDYIRSRYTVGTMGYSSYYFCYI